MTVSYQNKDILAILPTIDLGSAIAEQDSLLETARVETSVFLDLASDKVDLIPGTKGSGKSALFRIFVEFLAKYLLGQKRVVIAHGVDRPGDPVFHAFRKSFEKLSEDDFVSFWCIYVISLIHEQFLKNSLYAKHLDGCLPEIEKFLQASAKANIPEIKGKKSLKDILEWTLNALTYLKPKLKYKLPDNAGDVELTLFGDIKPAMKKPVEDGQLDTPMYWSEITEALEMLLRKSDLSIWIMIDKLDEIFPRRSPLERKALRGLLRTLRIFESPQVRLKIFLRDDMLSAVVSAGEGFAALSHVLARKADTLQWSADQILTMIINRLFHGEILNNYLNVDRNKLAASLEYRMDIFYAVFPLSVHKGQRQSNTLSWIYSHTADGNGVVTPRDVIQLLTWAKQHQYDLLKSDSSGESSSIIGSAAIIYGLAKLSEHKRTTYLEAEFPHIWPYMNKFVGGKAEYSEKALTKLLGPSWKEIVNDLQSIGFFSPQRSKEGRLYRIPHLYRKGMKITQGVVD